MSKNDDGKKMEDDLDINQAENKRNTTSADSAVMISASKAELIRKLLANINENCEKVGQLLGAALGTPGEGRIKIGQIGELSGLTVRPSDDGSGQIIEGVFDGENMIGPDGKQYSVPANYASKSKLVEGDILKLTITPSGTFVYKQIGPIERKRVLARLDQAPNGIFYALSDGRKWRILTASVTYFKGESGDEVVILTPKAGDSKWAAVENIVKQE